MSAQHYFEALHPDTHEHAGRAAEYRELANAAINDAVKWLGFAEEYEYRLLDIADAEVRRTDNARWWHYLNCARRHRETLENDVAWFRARDGFLLWVCATRFTERESEAIQHEYLARAVPLLAKYARTLDSIPWKGPKR